MAQLYYDNFEDIVVDEIDDIAPPERYIRLHCGTSIFIERWTTDNGRLLEVAYTKYDRQNGLVYRIRRNQEDRYKVKLVNMVDWFVPKDHYRRCIESMENV